MVAYCLFPGSPFVTMLGVVVSPRSFKTATSPRFLLQSLPPARPQNRSLLFFVRERSFSCQPTPSPTQSLTPFFIFYYPYFALFPGSERRSSLIRQAKYTFFSPPLLFSFLSIESLPRMSRDAYLYDPYRNCGPGFALCFWSAFF